MALNSFHQGVKDLRDMSGCHGFATKALNVLRYLEEEWDLGNASGEDPEIPTKDVRKLCMPSSSSLNLFCPIAINHMPGCVGPGISSTLYSPFPMQGLPLLADDDDLERDGFSKIP
jgi:hypothetical protein